MTEFRLKRVKFTQPMRNFFSAVPSISCCKVRCLLSLSVPGKTKSTALPTHVISASSQSTSTYFQSAGMMERHAGSRPLSSMIACASGGQCPA